MKRHSASRRARRGGFTLIEILVVVGILMLLVAMVAPRVIGSREQADINATRTQISNLENALRMYYLDCRRYPTTEEGLQALIERPAELAETVQWNGPYLDADSVPLDPWGNEYQYEFPPTRGTRSDVPNIWSLGPLGEDDDDIIANFTENGTGANGDQFAPGPANGGLPQGPGLPQGGPGGMTDAPPPPPTIQFDNDF